MVAMAISELYAKYFFCQWVSDWYIYTRLVILGEARPPQCILGRAIVPSAPLPLIQVMHAHCKNKFVVLATKCMVTMVAIKLWLWEYYRLIALGNWKASVLMCKKTLVCRGRSLCSYSPLHFENQHSLYTINLPFFIDILIVVYC